MRLMNTGCGSEHCMRLMNTGCGSEHCMRFLGSYCDFRTLYAVGLNGQDFFVPRVPNSMTAGGIWKFTPHPRGGQSLRPPS